jgi:hypothetical protein
MNTASPDVSAVAWVLGLVAAVAGSIISGLVFMLIKRLGTLTETVADCTQAVAILTNDFKRVDKQERQIEEMQPKLHEVYLWANRNGLRGSSQSEDGG